MVSGPLQCTVLPLCCFDCSASWMGLQYIEVGWGGSAGLASVTPDYIAAAVTLLLAEDGEEDDGDLL